MITTRESEARCRTLAPGEGEELRIFDEEFVIQVVGSEADEHYALATGSVAPGGGPPLHAHPGPDRPCRGNVPPRWGQAC